MFQTFRLNARLLRHVETNGSASDWKLFKKLDQFIRLVENYWTNGKY